MHPPFPFLPSPSVSADPPSGFGLALVKITGGDPRLIEQFQALAWSAYQDAGCPEGPDEDGMARWWSARIATMLN